MSIVAKLLWLCGSLVFGFAFTALAISISDPFQIMGLGLFTGLVVIMAMLLLRTGHDRKKNLYPQLFQQLSQNIEVVVFDRKGNLILSSKGSPYSNLVDFQRKFFSKIVPSTAAHNLENAMNTFHPIEALVNGGGDGLRQDEKWWLVRVIPHQKFMTVISNDLSQPLSNYAQIKQSYDQLEKFIDSAPFGLYYTSRSGHFVGVNATLANWMGRLKEEILGKRLSDILELSSENYVTLKNDPPEVLYRLFDGTANLVFRTPPVSLEQGASQDSFEKAPLPAIKINKSGQIQKTNAAFRHMLQEYLDLDHTESFLNIIADEQKSDVIKRIQRLFDSTHGAHPFEIKLGNDKIHTTTYFSRLDKDQLLLQFIDISEQKRLEQQFIQSQKMQAVGQLAGGIAHDFNNLLTAMLGFCDLLLQRYVPSDPSYNDIMQIKQNATRAANLVRQLLAFSRQQTLQPKVTHITDVLAELTALLRRLIGAGIDLQMVHGRDLWPIKVDPSQLEQVIINLVVNSRDAMGQEGKLLIRTLNYHSSKVLRLGHDIMPKGDYVLVEVQDNGHGIAPEHLEHIFEPFFSTKEVGAGTGLGLSTVYGIVKQTGGFVAVESSTQVPKGTTFKIYLPRHQGEEIIASPQTEGAPTDLTGGGTLLLVEDEDAVRLFSARALREKGYTVIEADSGETALELIERGDKFDLLVTDVVMPKMDGPTLSKKIKDIHPDLRTIFISGYTEDTFRKNLGHDAKIHFLAKPFSLKDLAAKVKDVLNS